jgi:ATP-binding cassette subfamily B protein RaxB
MALSGGQKQRVLLARALYRKPKILFLDEAFDQIDLALERRVTTGLQPLNLSIVVVSHRPETVDASVKRLNMGTTDFDYRQSVTQPVTPLKTS